MIYNAIESARPHTGRYYTIRDLTDAYVSGRIDVDEFEARLPALLRAGVE